jgi:hypothetical protein
MALITLSARKVRAEDGVGTVLKKQKVLICDGARRGLGCYAVQWAYADFEKSFLTFCRELQLMEMLANADILADEKTRQLTNSQELRSISSAMDDCTIRLERLVQILEHGDAPATVISRIRALESELQKLAESRALLTEEMKAAEMSDRYRLVEVESIHQLIDQLGALTGDQLVTVRSALAEHIRHLIKVVRVFPAGHLATEESVLELRTVGDEMGMPREEVEAHIRQHLRTAPERTGKGINSRYASQRNAGRLFSIIAKNGDQRVVFPDFDDPSVVKVELSTHGRRITQPTLEKVKAIRNAAIADGRTLPKFPV